MVRRHQPAGKSSQAKQETEANLSAPIQIGNITIHRIVEQEGPFFNAMSFFPDITRLR